MNNDVFRHYKLGIEGIDEDHLRMIELVEKITQTSREKKWLLGRSYLTELHLLKKEHFLEEECLMEKINFPYLSYHKLDHCRIVSELEKFLKQFGQNGLGFSSDRLVKNVLDHIDHYDRQIMPYYQKWAAAQMIS